MRSLVRFHLPLLSSESRRLQLRWEPKRAEKVIGDLQSGVADWTRHLLASDADGWKALPYVDECSRGALPSEAAPRDLRGLSISDIDLSSTDRLSECLLDFSRLEGVVATNSTLRGTSLRGASLGKGCDFQNSRFEFCDLRRARCKALMVGARFLSSDLRGADMRGSELRGCLFRDAQIRREGFLGVFSLSRRWTKLIDPESPSIDFDRNSDASVVRYAEEEQFAANLKRRHYGLASFWYVLTNFGQSPARLLMWAISIWFFFGLIYAGLPLPRFISNSAVGHLLVHLSPVLGRSGEPIERFGNWFEPFYFSTVTITTLGYGDITPMNAVAQCLASLEAVLGYIILGAFLSLLLQRLEIQR